MKINEKKKQIKAFKRHGKLIISSSEKDSIELLKQKEIFYKLVNERRFGINKLIEGIDFNNLTYHYKGKSAPKYFIRFTGPLII